MTGFRHVVLRTIIASLSLTAFAAAAGVLAGADVSSLPDIERDGGLFRDQGKPDDEITILRRHGCELFRVRVFVDPDPDPKKNWGATQSLDSVRSLARRIKTAGGRLLLDIHYSDTWADPQHQTKPKAWNALDFDALEKRVGDYTASIIKDLQAAGAGPDMVQVGNEITEGMLWPDGRVSYKTTPEAKQSWQKLARLLNAGVAAVRSCEKDGRRIPVVLHIHGGGRPGLPQTFFKRLTEDGGTPIDFDLIGLSFYPTWDDSLAELKKNMRDLVATHDKGILLAEVAYPWMPTGGIKGDKTMLWPQSPQGQAEYLRACRDALAELPNGRGVGYVWWYSDSIRVKGRPIWRDGNEALFDHTGEVLPAMKVFGDSGKVTETK
ncbi:MAG: glycosyl hydrolase 53 family protein [Tepidisphaeraceae bacterium]